MSWFEFWLILHILGAIVAFGPTFVFPVVGPYISRHPSHARFGFEVFHLIGTRLIVPFALTLPVTGIGLIATARYDFFKTGWLTVALGIYVVALCLVLFVQIPTVGRMIAAVGAADGSAAGPPPALLPLVSRARVVGGVLMLALVTIVVLMIVKPGGSTFR